MNVSISHWRWALLVLIPMWCIGLFGRGWWTPDEPREADIAWRMAHQPQKVIPYLADQPFLEKPPLSYWLSAGAQRLFGESPAITRLPNLLYALLATIAVGMLAQAMAGARAGWLAALIFATMFEVYRVAIWLAPDAALLASGAVALLAVYRGFTASNPRTKLYWYTLMHVAALCGFMAKSVPGWLVPGLALLALVISERQWRELINWRLWVGGVLQLLVLGGWLWAVSQRPDGWAELKVLFWNNLAGRFTDIHASGAYNYAAGHQNWFGKYLVESPYYVFPWILVVAAGIVHALRSWRQTAALAWRFALLAALPLTLLLSLAATARDVYFVPVCIGLSILAALWLDHSMQQIELTRLARGIIATTRGMMNGFLVLVIGGLALVAYAWPTQRLSSVLGMATLLIVHGAGWWRATATQRAAPLTLQHAVAGYVLTWCVAGVCLNPVIDQLQNLPALAQAIRADYPQHALALVNPDETTIAMMDRGVGKAIPIIQGDAQAIEAQARYWLASQSPSLLLVKLPGTGRGPLSRFIKPSSADHAVGVAAQFACHDIAHIVRVYELPHGRRYGVLAAGNTSSDDKQRDGADGCARFAMQGAQ